MYFYTSFHFRYSCIVLYTVNETSILGRQYPITSEVKTSLVLEIHADLVIFEPLNQIQLCSSTYKVTSYVKFTPYVHSFSNFETYLVNFTNELSSDVLACFQEAYPAHIVWGRYDVLKFPNHHYCSKPCQCGLLWQNSKIQEVK